MSGGTYKRGERVSVGYKHTDASSRDLSEQNRVGFSRPAFATASDDRNAAENSIEKDYLAVVPPNVYDTIKKCAEDYELEKGDSVVREAIETYGENERLLYWAFVFYVCDKFDIDSNKTRTDIVDNARRIIDNAFLPISENTEAFISKLPERQHDLRSLRVEKSLLPCPDDVKEKYDELADSRDKTVALTDDRLDEAEANHSSRSNGGFLSLMSEDTFEAKREEIMSYRKKTLSEVYREMKDVNDQIEEYIDYVNYNRDSVRRMIRNIKSESIDEIREIYTPQYIYSNYGGDGVTARVREILTEPTVAECAVFEYFSPCSPSIFESAPFVRLREATTSFGLACELTDLETVAREEYERISAEIEREFAEDFAHGIPQRFSDELDERLEMLTDRQKSVSVAVTQAKATVFSIVASTVIMILAMIGFAVGAYFAYVDAHSFIFAILFSCALLSAVLLLYFLARQIKRADRRSSDPGFSRANMFRELTDIKKLQRIYFEVGAEYLSARESLRDIFPQLREIDKKSADAT